MLLTLGRAAPLFLRNSHLVGVGDLTDSACEQDDTEQVFPSWQLMGMGGVWMQSWTLEVGDLTFPLIALRFKHAGYFLGGGVKFGFWRTSFPSGKRVTATLTSLAEDPSKVLRAVLCISVYSPALGRRARGAPRTQPPARKTSPQAEGAAETTG